jgi:hypothetical protein
LGLNNPPTSVGGIRMPIISKQPLFFGQEVSINYCEAAVSLGHDRRQSPHGHALRRTHFSDGLAVFIELRA